MKTSNILFDLDGTLTDSHRGIVKSIQHALDVLNSPIKEEAYLRSYIGTPLNEALTVLLETNDEALIQQALTIYRERYSSVGLYESELFPGVIEMLESLKAAYRLYVVTSKLQLFAETILRHFSLEGYFARVYGSQLDGRYSNKTDLIIYLLENEGILAHETLMIGDRKHDIIAAKQNGILSLGVRYGYGSPDELINAGADFICDNPHDIVTCVKVLDESTTRPDTCRDN